MRLTARVVLALGAAVALLGPWRLHWKDDIRELEIPTPELKANDSFVRSLFGESDGRTLYLTRGPTPALARAALELFLDWHGRQYPGAPTATLGYALPTEDEFRALPLELGQLGSFEPELKAALARHGFDPGAFQPFFDSWQAQARGTQGHTYDQVVAELARSLKGPMASLIHMGTGACWFVTLADEPSGAEPPPATSTVTAGQLENLNRLFGRYRISALELSSVGLGFVGASVFVLYGLRRGARIFAVPAGACLFAFGLFGLAGATLNLFNLLGAFLGVCLSHNYAIFSAESEGRGRGASPSIRMSAVATAASFGVLALSRIPVVAALGATVSVIVLAALAINRAVTACQGRPDCQA